jgi:pimeloyl-ACP methyl ester carboxylesterase
MAFDIDQTLYGGSMGRTPSDLIGAGFSLLALDLPCHGADATEPAGQELVCWRKRLEGGDRQLFTRFCSGLSAVLDHLNVQQAYVVGQSRGGYVAATCAAYDRRLTRLVLLKPASDLTRLSEFSGFDPGPDFLLTRYQPALIDRSILVRIGNADTRVGTDAAILFAQTVGATLRIVDTPGHDLPEDGSTVEWLTK